LPKSILRSLKKCPASRKLAIAHNTSKAFKNNQSLNISENDGLFVFGLERYIALHRYKKR